MMTRTKPILGPTPTHQNPFLISNRTSFNLIRLPSHLTPPHKHPVLNPPSFRRKPPPNSRERERKTTAGWTWVGERESMSFLGKATPESPPEPAPPPPPPPRPLFKQKSWSSDSFRDEAWLRRKGNNRKRSLRRTKSVTDDDVDELKACFELGFGFDSPDLDRKVLSDTIPALELYFAVNNQYNSTILKPPRLPTTLTPSSSSSSCSSSECDSSSPIQSPQSIIVPGENPQLVKTRLKQWAQVVACSVRQSSS